MVQAEDAAGGLTFSDLVDTATVREMMADFYAATGFVVGIVDRNGTIVVQVGYRDICTRFHRACPETEHRCIESDTHINTRLEQGEFIDYTCANGLIDAASPIVIDGEHLATIYTGQFFFEPPDTDYFDAQAERFGFDVVEYRQALEKVPVVSRRRYEAVMSFLTRFAEVLAELGLQAKRRRQTEAAVRQADKMEAVGRLAGGVAHDLNNMLQVILGHADVARFELGRGGSPGRSIDEAIEAAKRAHGMVNQLLAFGRKSETRLRRVDVSRVVRDLMQLVERLIGAHIEVAMDLDTELPPVLADPGQLEQIIMNLSVNARDAMPAGGEIRIRTRFEAFDGDLRRRHPETSAPHDLVVLEVSDTGGGIPQDHLEHIFEPFFTTKDAERGTGLGLATVYALAEQHGGFVEVDSIVGSGSSFRVAFPAQSRVPTAPVPLESPAEQWTGGHETILLAEDERQVRDFAQQVLESAGYRVLTACDGAEAVRRVETDGDAIDMLVLDVIMPHRNGREVFETARHRDPDVPVLFCSAYTQNVLRHEHTLDLPAGHLLQKPFTPGELLFHVRRLLDLRPVESETE